MSGVKRISLWLVSFIIIVVGVSLYVFSSENTRGYENYGGFTIELNCTLPNVPDKMKIFHIESRSINEDDLREIAINVFGFKNITSIHYEDTCGILRSVNKTLSYYVTDYIRFEDRTYEEKVVDVNKTLLRSQGEGFIRLLNEYWGEPTDTELVFERMEFPDLYLHSRGGDWRSEQPQYIVYYHHLNGTPILALNAEFNLGFADEKIVYAQISRINVANATTMEITKTPMDAILEAFPHAKMGGSFGIASQALIPVRGKIIIEDIRLFYYNWNDSILGESYDLVPHYKIKALCVGPDIHGKTQRVLGERVISAIG